EARHAGAPGFLHQPPRHVDVHSVEALLSGLTLDAHEIDDGVHAGEHVVRQALLGQVAADGDGTGRRRTAATIDRDYRLPTLEQRGDDVAADEPTGSGDENLHWGPPLVSHAVVVGPQTVGWIGVST